MKQCFAYISIEAKRGDEGYFCHKRVESHHGEREEALCLHHTVSSRQNYLKFHHFVSDTCEELHFFGSVSGGLRSSHDDHTTSTQCPTAVFHTQKCDLEVMACPTGYKRQQSLDQIKAHTIGQ